MSQTRCFFGLRLALSGLALLGCSEQPEPRCATTLSTFAAHYELESGTGACAELSGEILGAMTFVTDWRADDDGLYSVAIQSLSAGDLVAQAEANEPPLGDPDPDHRPYGIGKFTERTPDDAGVCSIPSFAPAELDMPEIPATEPDTEPTPATSLAYQWSNFRLAVSAGAQGMQWAADLTYTRDGCSASYRVRAVAPAVSCDDGAGNADDAACTPDAAELAGVHPSLAGGLVCDPTLLACVLANEPEL
jgi:hypothetical protein